MKFIYHFSLTFSYTHAHTQVSDEEIEAFIRKYGQSATHPVSPSTSPITILILFLSIRDGPDRRPLQTSSARMGTNPETSVVDPQLCVHGIRALRVVDASVFPDQVSGHPCVPVIAVAERAADLIRGVA